MAKRTDQELAEWLRVARAKAGINQSELAERAGVSRPVVSRLERAAVRDGSRISVWADIADALGASDADRAYLLGGTAP